MVFTVSLCRLRKVDLLSSLLESVEAETHEETWRKMRQCVIGHETNSHTPPWLEDSDLEHALRFIRSFWIDAGQILPNMLPR